jgi:hypothetical protein
MNKLTEAMDLLGLSITAEFIPFSKSRNAKENAKVSNMSLNWRVTLMRHDIRRGEVQPSRRAILTADYSQGIGHAPSYKQGRLTVDDDTALRIECETGRKATGRKATDHHGNLFHYVKGRPIPAPKASDVMESLLLDADVLDHSTFEEWATDCGYDPDSRSAERIYRTCLELALQMRNGIGEDGLRQLREALEADNA